MKFAGHIFEKMRDGMALLGHRTILLFSFYGSGYFSFQSGEFLSGKEIQSFKHLYKLTIHLTLPSIAIGLDCCCWLAFSYTLLLHWIFQMTLRSIARHFLPCLPTTVFFNMKTTKPGRIADRLLTENDPKLKPEHQSPPLDDDIHIQKPAQPTHFVVEVYRQTLPCPTRFWGCWHTKRDL